MTRTEWGGDRNAARCELERIVTSGHRFGWGRGKWADYLELRDGCVVVEDTRDPGTAVIVGHGVALTCVTESMYLDPADMEDGDE